MPEEPFDEPDPTPTTEMPMPPPDRRSMADDDNDYRRSMADEDNDYRRSIIYGWRQRLQALICWSRLNCYCVGLLCLWNKIDKLEYIIYNYACNEFLGHLVFVPLLSICNKALVFVITFEPQETGFVLASILYKWNAFNRQMSRLPCTSHVTLTFV